MRYLHSGFACQAKAIAYLHDDRMIKDKQIKPSEVMLSSNGLWMTYFGWFLDISELSNSATDNGLTISAKYHASERASRGKRYYGRSEDIFGLDCIYSEMMYQIVARSVHSRGKAIHTMRICTRLKKSLRCCLKAIKATKEYGISHNSTKR